MFRKAPPVPPSSNDVVTDAAPCQKAVRLRVAPEAIAPVRQVVLAEFQRQANLPGFRKGKAPVELVERQYAKEIQDETLHRVTRQAFEEAAKAHQLKPVGPFEVRKADFDGAGGLMLEATVEVEPAFPLGDYKGIALTQDAVAVTPKDVEDALASLQESMAQLVPSGQGEAKERKLAVLDDEFAKDLGFQTLAALREHLEAKLREQKRSASAQRLESALYDELLRRHPFAVPPRLVEHQTQRLTGDFKARLLLSGVPEGKTEEETGKLTEQLRTSAERHVKLTFILDRIAAQEAVTVTQDELVGRMWQLAQRSKKDPAEMRKLFDERGLWPSVVSAIRQEKTVALLLAAASIQNGTTQT